MKTRFPNNVFFKAFVEAIFVPNFKAEKGFFKTIFEELFEAIFELSQEFHEELRILGTEKLEQLEGQPAVFCTLENEIRRKNEISTKLFLLLRNER